MARISNIQVTGDSKTFRERAKKQLESIEAEHVQQVLEEYTRIPHTLLPLEMLSVPLETRITIRESVAKAKATLVARVSDENEADDKQAVAQRIKRRSSATRSDHAQRGAEDVVSGQKSLLRDSASSNEANVDDHHRSGASILANDQGGVPQIINTASVEAFARIFKETGASAATAPITSAVLEALTPPSSRAGTAQGYHASGEQTSNFQAVIGSKQPSKNNPFASFLTEKSDAEAEQLPNELMLCYFAHNQVQDRLRSIWRQKKKSCSAEQVAREVWEQLPEKHFAVSKEFEGQLVKKALSIDEMVYVWVNRFWERCKSEAW